MSDDNKPWLNYIKDHIEKSTPQGSEEITEMKILIHKDDIYLDLEELSHEELKSVIYQHIKAHTLYQKFFHESMDILKNRKILFKDPITRLEYLQSIALETTKVALKKGSF